MNKPLRSPAKRRKKNNPLPLFMGALILSCWAVYLASGSPVAGQQQAASHEAQQQFSAISPNSPPDRISLPPAASKDAAGVAVSSSPTAEPVSLSDLLFIGDSRTEGLMLYGGIGKANFFYQTGLSVSSALQKEFVKLQDGRDGTLEEGLSERSFKQIYLMFGVNELGWPDTGSFVNRYREVIALIRQKQPDAKIVIQSIIPVTEKKSQGDEIYNNGNIKKFNSAIQAMAEEDGLTYLDLTDALTDEKGNLPADASVDGVHLKKNYCTKWAARIEEEAGLQDAVSGS